MQADRGEKKRVWAIAILLLLVLTGEGVRLGFLHLGNHSQLKEDTQKKRMYSQKLLGLRGRIFDCSGDLVPLATSLSAKQFFVDPLDLKKGHDKAFIIDTAVDALCIPREIVENAFAQTNSRHEKICVSYDNAAIEVMADRKTISGIASEDVILRSYPQGRRMSHVIGILDKDGNGKAGVEYKYDDHLKGAPGLVRGEKDARGRRIGYRPKVNIPAIRGNDIYLTLNNNIQFDVEEALKEVVENIHAVSAWAIVQDVKTGAILAMATYPDFDPKNYGIAFQELWRNHAISSMYEPGSVMKTITMASALNERLVTVNTPMDVGYGPFVYAGSTLKNNSAGTITVAHGFKISNNVVFAKLGLMLGAQRIETYMKDFGFDSRLGIDLPGEAKGMLDAAKRPWNKWDKIKPTRVPIGQGVSVTGLQMITAYSAVANGGKLMRPYVVDRIVSPTTNGVIFQMSPEVIKTPIRPEVAQIMRETMIDVTEDGTGTKARVEGYTVAGKTGTAQCWDNARKVYSTTEFVASFVGFVPARDPVFSVLVSIDRPAPGYARTGGAVAAPVFSKIATAAARYLLVPPDLPSEQESTWVSVGARR